MMLVETVFNTTGPGIREGVIYDRAVESIDLVPTLGAMLSFSPSFAQGKRISELL
jgi:hypothetical protein